jgi:hypothetical protein
VSPFPPAGHVPRDPPAALAGHRFLVAEPYLELRDKIVLRLLGRLRGLGGGFLLILQECLDVLVGILRRLAHAAGGSGDAAVVLFDLGEFVGLAPGGFGAQASGFVGAHFADALRRIDALQALAGGCLDLDPGIEGFAHHAQPGGGAPLSAAEMAEARQLGIIR